MASMRPPLAGQLAMHRPRRDAVDLIGKRVLLTGASSGIGESAAEQFARHGAIVIVVARRQELLDTVVERIERPEATRRRCAATLPTSMPSTAG